VTGRIKSLKNSSDSIGNRTRDLPACSVVPQIDPLVLLEDGHEWAETCLVCLF
jgi:hypothetical protein